MRRKQSPPPPPPSTINGHNLNFTFLLIFRSQGGVKLVSGTGRITLDNTMEERLRLLEDKVTLIFFFLYAN